MASILSEVCFEYQCSSHAVYKLSKTTLTEILPYLEGENSSTSITALLRESTDAPFGPTSAWRTNICQNDDHAPGTQCESSSWYAVVLEHFGLHVDMISSEHALLDCQPR